MLLKPESQFTKSAGRAARMFIILLSALSATLAFGQDLKSVEPVYHPGEQIHLILTFDGPVDLTGAGVGFRLTTLKEESQRLWDEQLRSRGTEEGERQAE